MEVAAQLYVFTETPDLPARMPEILLRLADGGYTGIEGMSGQPPFTRAEMEPSGLRYLMTHFGSGRFKDVDAVLEDARQKGCTAALASGPLNWNSRTAADFYELAPVLNAAGRRLRDEAGLTLHYHNHDFEFHEVEPGRTGMDILLDGLDFDVIKFCLDAGWVTLAGQDIVRFVRENADRIGMFHLRDFRGHDSVALGQGDLDLRPLIKQLPSLPNLTALLVEQDPTTPTPLEDMLESRRYLREMFDI